MEFGKADWRTFKRGIEKEWLLTNGIGGFSSSTIIGANTRRYHGLLVAALKPPVARHLVLSKIEESVIIDNQTHYLNSFCTSDYISKGFLNLQRFVKDPLPEFTFTIRDMLIEKKVSMVYGENTVVILYHVVNGSDDLRLRLTPLVNFRDYHQNSSRWHMDFKQEEYEKGTIIKPYNLDVNINIYCSDGVYVKENDCYFYNMEYPVEHERGLHPTEDHYIPGNFNIDIKPGEERIITVIATIEPELKNTDGPALIKAEEERIQALVDNAGYGDELAKELVKAADQFIVYRKSTGAKTIIAGYPWFTDWGRDTMIALPGLTLATRRYDDAWEILYTFSRYVKDGLIPNMFPDAGVEPAYNTVDAPLWYFEAVNKYVNYTKRYDLVKAELYDSLKSIIEHYVRGTHFNIKMDSDNLISAGDEGTQLTWMDAKVGDWVVTPRHGKAVEINALWYNALKVMAGLAKEYGEDYSYYDDMAAKVKEAFKNSFWNENEQCLYDVITNQYKDGKTRPNQIFAVSLSHPVIEGENAKKVVEKVWKQLYTAYGLRSLSPKDEEYKGIYTGDQYKRDGAYHQGTVWGWLIGHFISAYLKVNNYSQDSKRMAQKFINPFKDHLKDACIGSISEIFDGDEPLTPRGCFAQAWSVGEVLRTFVEDIHGK